jgi:hypothetical protein
MKSQCQELHIGDGMKVFRPLTDNVLRIAPMTDMVNADGIMHKETGKRLAHSWFLAPQELYLHKSINILLRFRLIRARRRKGGTESSSTTPPQPWTKRRWNDDWWANATIGFLNQRDDETRLQVFESTRRRL